MSAFCTIADVGNFLQVDTAGHEAAINRAIAEASSAIQNYCHQVLELVEDDEITLDCAGGARLLLPELPVTDLAEVVEDGETLVETDDYKLGGAGILYRIGAKWANGVQIVTVTYSHGYAVLPDDLVGVATRMAARAFQAGLRAAELGGVPGITATSLGDYSVSFGGESGSDGVLGASGAPVLLRSEKEILNAYRQTR